MDITVQSHVSLYTPTPPLAEGAEPELQPDAVSAVPEDEELLSDGYTPSLPAEDDGIYTRDSVIKKLKETQEALLNVAREDGALPVDAEKLSEIRGQKDPTELDEGDNELVKRLEQRDREVRLHEQSHAAIAGKYAEGPPTYSYQMGPDGKMYAIGGSLAVDTGKEADPAENRNKARILQSAAMGVAEPSAADSIVSMQAADLAADGAQ